MNRQKLVLLILAVLFVSAVVYAYFLRPQQGTVNRLKNVPGAPAESRRGEPAKGEKAEQHKLNLALLDQPSPRFSGYKRNIFWLPVPVTKKKLPPPPPPPPVKPAAPPPPPPPPTPREIATMEMAKFKFLGFLKKDNRKTIFLHKDSNEIILVRKGDKIANKYEVSNITDEALTINSLGEGGGQIVIPLVENMPLTPR